MHPNRPPFRPPLSIDEARDLAADLIRELTQHAGNPDAVRAVLLDHLDRLDVARLAVVCMAAVHTTFADCLTPVPASEAEAGALALTPPTEGDTAA